MVVSLSRFCGFCYDHILLQVIVLERGSANKAKVNPLSPAVLKSDTPLNLHIIQRHAMGLGVDGVGGSRSPGHPRPKPRALKPDTMKP